jgi:hypothetical protein
MLLRYEGNPKLFSAVARIQGKTYNMINCCENNGETPKYLLLLLGYREIPNTLMLLLGYGETPNSSLLC